jgi:predicted enzyme related to lactoylglutathione lyase
MGTQNSKLGSVGWQDLTVPNAVEISDFYAAVVGWEKSPVSMGDYDDFNMLIPGTDEPAAGVCHAQGVNSDLPAQWLIYVHVADAYQAAEACERAGGKVLAGPRKMGDYGFCVIQDPAGAVLGLMSSLCHSDVTVL